MPKIQSESARLRPYFIDFSDLYRRAEDISHAYQSGNLVFFLGAGASKAFQSQFPSWSQLLKDLLAETQIEGNEGSEIRKLIEKGEYLLAAEALKRFAIVDRVNRDDAIDRKVSDILERKVADGDPILQLGVLDFETPIVTTNYDMILEKVLRQHDLDKVDVFTFENDEQISARLDPTKAQSQYVFKLHGSASATHGHLILDEGDYADLYFRGRWPIALALLRHLLATKMVIFVGFSLSDPEIMPLLRQATRFASSYQHLAFFKEGDLTKIEREVLRSHYFVDPVLYQKHLELPLYILEMRNFHPRERLTVKLLGKRLELARAAAAIRSAEDLDEKCSMVLFGSYAKYGDRPSDDADIDILFLSPSEIESRTAGINAAAQELLGRKVDATLMSRLEFEELLHQGDAFASSILVTGSPIEDPKSIFALLARGFRPRYIPEVIVNNAHHRCRLRWLRLCAVRNAEQAVFLRACQQWSLAIMQLAIVQRKLPTTLLEASLLGNARYVIREFAQKFHKADEKFFLDLMRRTKGMPISRKRGCPKITDVVNSLWVSLEETNTDRERDLLQPLLQAVPSRIVEVYTYIKALLRDIDPANTPAYLYGRERKLCEELQAPDLRNEINTFDWLLFFELDHHLSRQEADPDDKELRGIIKTNQKARKALTYLLRPPSADAEREQIPF
jgi:predicted nucleotidyltransferase